MSRLLLGLQLLTSKALEIYRIALLIYFLMSWLPSARQSSFGQFLERLCEPYVSFFRRFIPPIGMISFAGVAAYFSLALIERGLNVIFLALIRLFA